MQPSHLFPSMSQKECRPNSMGFQGTHSNSLNSPMGHFEKQMYLLWYINKGRQTLCQRRVGWNAIATSSIDTNRHWLRTAFCSLFRTNIYRNGKSKTSKPKNHNRQFPFVNFFSRDLFQTQDSYNAIPLWYIQLSSISNNDSLVCS